MISLKPGRTWNGACRPRYSLDCVWAASRDPLPTFPQVNCEVFRDTGVSWIVQDGRRRSNGLGLALAPKQLGCSDNSINRSESRSMPEAAPLDNQDRGCQAKDSPCPPVISAQTRHSRKVVNHDGQHAVIEHFDKEILDGRLVGAHGKRKVTGTDDDRVIGAGFSGLLGKGDGVLGRAATGTNEKGHVGVRRVVESFSGGTDHLRSFFIHQVGGYIGEQEEDLFQLDAI